MLNVDGSQHRFAFARNGSLESEFANALVCAGVRLGTPTTVLRDGDAGLWKLQQHVLPNATLVLDWWHIAMRFEQALQAARGLAREQRAFIFTATPSTTSKVQSGNSGMVVLALALGVCRNWQIGLDIPTFVTCVVRPLFGVTSTI